jgi:hypothetical protein
MATALAKALAQKEPESGTRSALPAESPLADRSSSRLPASTERLMIRKLFSISL